MKILLMESGRFSKIIYILVSVISQLISSGTNFLFVVHLLRVFDVSEFGVYSIAFAVLLASSAVINSFFQLQMVVRVAGIESEQQARFASSLFASQILFCMLLVVFFYLGARFFFPSVYVKIAIATSVSVLTLSAKEYVLRYLFLKEGVNLKILSVNVVLMLSLLLVVVFDLLDNTSEGAMISYAIANGVAALIGIALANFRFRDISPRADLAVIFKDGMWASFSAAFYSVRAAVHTFAVGIMLPTSEVGRMNAARTFVTPATLLIPAMSSLVLPRLSIYQRKRGFRAFKQLIRVVLFSLTALVLFYGVMLYFFWSFLQAKFLSSGYAGLGFTVAFWFVYALSTVGRNVLEWSAQSMGSFQSLTIYNFVGGFLAIVMVFSLTPIFGSIGAITGSIIGEMVMVFWLYIDFSRHAAKLQNSGVSE